MRRRRKRRGRVKVVGVEARVRMVGEFVVVEWLVDDSAG